MDSTLVTVVEHHPFNRAGRDFVIGDLHGCLDALRFLLREIEFDPSRDRLFSVGDLVDRGSQSEEALALPDKPSAILSAPMACTPETDRSCHYFMTLGANYGEEPVGAALEAQAKALWDIVLTDKEAVESIQEAYNRFGAATPDASVRADEAAVRYRLMLAQQAKDEGQIV